MTEAPKSNQYEKIAVITSDNSIGDRFVKALSEAGYSVLLASNATDGLKVIYDSLPHLILLDSELNGGSGYEILEKKTAEPLLAKIPVYFMSTQGTPINMRKVPAGSVAEFVMALNAGLTEVVSRINKQFGHPDMCSGSEEVPPNKGKKIVWIEDDKLIRSILGKKLSASGFDVSYAKNGEEALGLLEQSSPEAIVIDLLLPGMSGFDILQHIRANDKFKKTPVMILSNLSKPSDIEKARVLGAQKFLVKSATSLDEIVMQTRELCK